MLFSIVIPAYNYGQCLSFALESVLSQEGDDFEILVIDDGSTDDTPAVLSGLRSRHPDRFRSIRQENSGLAAVRNRGIVETTGEYLIFLDADDRLLPGALASFRNFLERNGRPGMVCGGHLSVHPDGKVRRHSARPLSSDKKRNFLAYMRKEFGISNGGVIMARHVFDGLSYPEHLSNNEDVPVFAQILARYDCATIEDMVLEIHKHDDSMRNNIDLTRLTGTRTVDALFDPAVLPGDLMTYKSEFLGRQYLSLFRSFYVAKEFVQARNYYKEAIRSYPSLLFEWSYLRKYLRILWK